MDIWECAMCSLEPCSPWEVGRRRSTERGGGLGASTVSTAEGIDIQDLLEHATFLSGGDEKRLQRTW